MKNMGMGVFRAWLASGLALFLAAGCVLASAGSAEPKLGVAVSGTDGPEADLRAARALVLVVVDTADRKLKGSEAYGDWQYYLASFVERLRGELVVHQVTPDRTRKMLPKWPRGLRNATIFINRDGKGLLHRGFVLEPQVYLIGKTFAETGAVQPEAASFGLEPFNLK